MIKRIFILLMVLLLALPLYGVSCNYEGHEEIEDGEYYEEVEGGENHEGAEVGKVLDIKIGLSLQSSLAQGVSFENVEVQIGTLAGPASNPWNGRRYDTGDICMLVLGDIKNDTSENLTVAASAEGYNSDWEEVAWTLSSGWIVGSVVYSLPQHSTESFEIILNWAEDVKFIEIGAKSLYESPYQPPEGLSEIYFPVLKEVSSIHMAALTEGKLVQDNGYLRLERNFIDGSDRALLVWPYGFSLRIKGEETQVVNNDGQIIATVGDTIKVGGGEAAAEIVEKYLGQTLPKDCSGPYWIVSEVVAD